jgi:TRAP-type C4-dicarboxylate transport system permease small subunit
MVLALRSRQLPRWLRIALVICFVVLAGGAILFGYRYATHPATLTVAAGSIDGDVPRLDLAGVICLSRMQPAQMLLRKSSGKS